MEKEKILLHACCAICAGYPIQKLKEDGFEPIVYYFNPNIYPDVEYQRRQNALEKLCEEFDSKLIVDNTKQELYSEMMSEYKNYPEGSERCKKCFEMRLQQSAFKAKELGIKKFTTTLSSSPHKKFEIIQQIGLLSGKSFDIEFIEYNFKKQDGFLKTVRIANSLGLYKQNYCGCENSMQRLSQKQISSITPR